MLPYCNVKHTNRLRTFFFEASYIQMIFFLLSTANVIVILLEKHQTFITKHMPRKCLLGSSCSTLVDESSVLDRLHSHNSASVYVLG